MKLTENIFDKKKQKAATAQSFGFCLMYAFVITVSPNFLLMEGVWQALEKTGRGFTPYNLLTMWFRYAFFLNLVMKIFTLEGSNEDQQ